LDKPGLVRQRLIAIATEALALLIVVAAAVMVFGMIASTDWEDLFLYNGDSLVLPLLEQSLAKGEPIHWVFSSQLFVFPEAVLYALSSLVTEGPRSALVLNGVLNLVVLYALIRAISGIVLSGLTTRIVRAATALAVTLAFVTVVLLEFNATVNQSAIATTFLTTTYYYGVIVIGLLVVLLVLGLTRAFAPERWGTRRTILYSIALLVPGILTSFANPLLIVQVFAPLIVALFFLVISRRLRFLPAGYLTLLFGVSAVGGLLGRRLFPAFEPGGLAGYVSPDNAGKSVEVLLLSLEQTVATALGVARLIVVTAPILLALVTLGFAIVALFRRTLRDRLTTIEVFTAAFVSASAVSLVVGMVVTGSQTTRYLEPLAVFPLLVWIVLVARVLRTGRREWAVARMRIGLLTTAAVSIAVLLLSALAAPQVATMVEGDDYSNPECLDEFLDGGDANGVGSFWLTRPLQLYGTHEGNLLQVLPNLTPLRWMINLGSYEDKTFSYMVIDDPEFLGVDSLDILGPPQNVIACDDYTIFDFAGTEGEQILTEIIATGGTSGAGYSYPYVGDDDEFENIYGSDSEFESIY